MGMRAAKAKLDEALDELREDGFKVLDDLNVGSTRLAHCVVGPTGVFAIEPEHNAEPGRVLGEAHRVARLLHAAGVDEDVRPVIALTNSRHADDTEGVSMVTPSEVVDFVKKPCHTLHEEDVDHIRHVLSLYRRRSA